MRSLLKILVWLQSFVMVRNPEFPRSVNEHWYCGKWYLYLADLHVKGEHRGTTLNPPDMPVCATDVVAFNPWRTGHIDNDVSGLVDGLIPAIRIGDKVGLYRQVGRKYRTTSFYDGAPWDDGYHVDLEFVRAIAAMKQTGVNS